MTTNRVTAFAIALLACATHARAGDMEALLAKLRLAHPSTDFDSIRPSPVEGLYEVRMGGNIAYVPLKQPGYFLFGHLYDSRTGKDLTEASSMQATLTVANKTLNLADLPLADAIVRRQGKGSHRLILFTDPSCPFCQRLDTELLALPDVTVYQFMVPFLGTDLPRKVWCMPDRVAALKAAMHGELLTTANTRCPDPLERNLELASRLGVHGTPTIFLPSGGRIEGFATAKGIASALSDPPVARQPKE